MRGLLSPLVAVVFLLVAAPADAQLFFASRPEPPFTVGPLVIRASVVEGSSVVAVSVLWSLVIPSTLGSTDVAQDLYLLWPSEVQSHAALGKPDPTLARYVEAREFSVIGEGRLGLFARGLSESAVPEAQPGGAPFAVFVEQGGALGLSAPATLIRIPWTPRLAERGWLLDLRMTVGGLIKPRKTTWAEELFVGGRYLFSMSFNEVRDRPLFAMYFAHRDRVVRLADAPAEMVASFAHSDRLKIDQVIPPTAIRRLSETEDSTEIVSLFLDKTEGITPQHLAVQFGYFSRTESWMLLLIPALFLMLGQAIGPVINRTLVRLVNAARARVHLGGWHGAPRARQSGVILSRDALGRIVPGETTHEEVVRLCGAAAEQHEQFPASDRRTLIYRGQRLVPKTHRRFGWVSTVLHWDAEEHEVRIELSRDVVADVQAQIRYHRLTGQEPT